MTGEAVTGQAEDEFEALETELEQEAAAEAAGQGGPAPGEAEAPPPGFDIDTGELLYQILWSPLKTLLRSPVSEGDIRAMCQAQGAALDICFPNGFMNPKWLATASALALTLNCYQLHRAGRSAAPATTGGAAGDGPIEGKYSVE